jgi:murein DD-endopeptidase MepM/ murein hydrolase activator NlpD
MTRRKEIRLVYGGEAGWKRRRKRSSRARWALTVVLTGLLAYTLSPHLSGLLTFPSAARPVESAATALAIPHNPAASTVAPDAGPGGTSPARPAGTDAVAAADANTVVGTRPASLALPPADDRVRITVAPGDTMASIFQRQGLTPAVLDRIVHLNEHTAELANLKVGQQLEFVVREGELQELVHETDFRTALVVERQGDDFQAERRALAVESHVASAHGRIDSSLFESAQASGLSDFMSIRLAEVFGYDIDFVLDIRAGDEFTVIYEQHSRPGRPVEDGEIMAAEFVNAGQVYRAVRYVQADGTADYYSTEGASLKKSFLRTPVNFTRISSHFNLRRKHPVLNTIRAHKGVDYAAPVGTPVRATGDGKVAFVGTKGGYGKAIVLQHGDRYSTVYAHLSRFARAISSGQRVRQGQTIGYVGKSGLATGPHLHYEFQVDGTHRNPLTVNLPRGESIPDRLLADFRRQTGVWLAQLDSLKRERAIASSAVPSGRSLAAKLPEPAQQYAR